MICYLVYVEERTHGSMCDFCEQEISYYGIFSTEEEAESCIKCLRQKYNETRRFNDPTDKTFHRRAFELDRKTYEYMRDT